MIYIKIYEDFAFDFQKREKEISQIKNLTSQINDLFIDLGFDNQNYMDFGKYETEFFKNGDYLFAVIISYTLDKRIIFKKSLANENIMVDFIPEYFKSIKGLQLMLKEGNYEYDFFIKDKNIDNIIKQISKEDFLFKFETNKYNL